MEIEIVSEEEARRQLHNGDFSLQLLVELSEYFQRPLLDTIDHISNQYLSGDTDCDIFMIKENGKVVAGASAYIEYEHVHTGCRTLIVYGIFGMANKGVAKKKLLKALYAQSQIHQCVYLQTQEFIGYKGSSMRFLSSIRKLVGD